MSAPQLSADDLDHDLPPLLVGAAVVALVPATDLRGWAAATAWKVARAAAASGRRTALVDCFVDAPTLHGVGGAANDEGIVDAFEYGASLNRIVQAQPQANLFFIPTGTFAADAAPMMQNPRWRRLSAGFRHEEALLLLYVSADHLGRLAADPDGMVVLAPQGLDLAVADAPALTQAVGRGMPLLAVVANESRREARGESGRESGGERSEPVFELVTDEPDSASPAAELQGPVPMAGLLAAQSRPNWLARFGIVLGLAAAAAVVWYAVMQNRGTAAGSRESGVVTPDTSAVSRQPSAVSPSPPAPRLPPVESLPFAVQVAALPDLLDAFAVADSLTAHGTPAIVSPVRPRGRGVLYRVHAGPFATAARADSALAALRTAGTIAGGGGTRDSLPLSIALGAGLTQGAARTEQLRLRAAGVPAFILGAADGTFRLFAGAYSASAQAILLQDLLTPTGSAGDLVPRAGYVP